MIRLRLCISGRNITEVMVCSFYYISYQVVHDFILFFQREQGRKRNINVRGKHQLVASRPLVCTLTGNWTCNPLITDGMMLQPSHTGQGSTWFNLSPQWGCYLNHSITLVSARLFYCKVTCVLFVIGKCFVGFLYFNYWNSIWSTVQTPPLSSLPRSSISHSPTLLRPSAPLSALSGSARQLPVLLTITNNSRAYE